MPRKCPYVFAAKSRAAMVAYLLGRKSYADRSTLYPFAWDVKAHNVDWRRPAGEYKLNPEHDSAWAARLESHDGFDVESAAFEDVGRSYTEGEWTSYPGNDPGDWIFTFAGRSGGHLVLTKWRRRSLDDMSTGELESWLRDLPRPDLRAFYRGIVCADSDFTRAKASENVEYAANYIRGQWEEERDDARDRATTAAALQMEADRPDLYAAA